MNPISLCLLHQVPILCVWRLSCSVERP